MSNYQKLNQEFQLWQQQGPPPTVERIADAIEAEGLMWGLSRMDVHTAKNIGRGRYHAYLCKPLDYTYACYGKSPAAALMAAVTLVLQREGVIAVPGVTVEAVRG